VSVQSNLEEAFALLDAHRDDVWLVGPASRQAIQETERLLGVQFPPSYRAFVEREGAGSINGREIYGVVANPQGKSAPNVVWMTLDLRASARLPDRYLIIVGFDDSSSLALDASQQGSDGEYPVVRIWPGEDEDELVDSEVASDFGSFLLRFVEERLSL
jgi:cell wall assembly regulator SMI1